MNSKNTFFLLLFISVQAFGQSPKNLIWANNGHSYFTLSKGEIVIQEPGKSETIQFVTSANLIPSGAAAPIQINSFTLSDKQDLVLIQTNAKKVWRYETIGDYYIFNVNKKSLQKVGKSMPAASSQFAKIAPNGKWVAFVSGHNIYAENIQTGKLVQLTKDGSKYLINGTFDWVYEEEFFCRDGFRWSPDSKQIAYWQVNATGVKNYLMINNTDSTYPFAVPVEYPIAGEKPSPVKIGVVSLDAPQTKWIATPDDAKWGSYIPRMEWVPNSKEIIIQHLNRKQNTSQLLLANVQTAKSKMIYKEQEKTWVDIRPTWDFNYANGGWDWLSDGKHFLWANESDGWRHFYIQSTDGENPICITPGNYDVMKTAGG
jgi:dipeptidyl-peptidase-4